MIKKIFKILGKIVLGIGLILLVVIAFVYFKYNEPLPKGIEGAEADALASKMLIAVKHEDYKNTRYLSWTFPGGHHYVWDKDQHKVDVSWNDTTVNLNLKNPTESSVLIDKQKAIDKDKTNAIEKALSYFNNDSFWLVAPHKIFDTGVKRSIVTQENGDKALLITYSSGGTTPGDSYLWILDENAKPIGYQMWVSIIPIGGLYASWDNWEIMESGIPLPTLHTILVMDLDLENVKAWN